MIDVIVILSVLCIVEFLIIVVVLLRVLHWKAQSEFLEKLYHNCRNEIDRAYKYKDELARELKVVVDAAISFIRNPESSRGYDPNTNVGRIAKAVFLKWVRSQEAK